MKVKIYWDDAAYFGLCGGTGRYVSNDGKVIRMMKVGGEETEVEEVITAGSYRIGIKKVDDPRASFSHIGVFVKED